jgi:hypothetical protein
MRVCLSLTAAALGGASLVAFLVSIYEVDLSLSTPSAAAPAAAAKPIVAPDAAPAEPAKRIHVLPPPPASLSEARKSDRLSTVACEGDSPGTRRCILENVWFINGVIALLAEEGPPPVLCSTVNAPEQYAVQCPFRLMPYEEVVDVDASRQFETAVGIARLNPYNLYHALFEVSLYSCMCSQRDRHLISAV